MADYEKLARDAQMDQTVAGLDSFAGLVGAYYRSLLLAGVSSDLTARLVRDWHWLLQHRTQYPDRAPRVVPSE